MSGPEEISNLRSCVHDLLQLTSLPEQWLGREAPEVLENLVAFLATSLDLDLAQVRISDPLSGKPIENSGGKRSDRSLVERVTRAVAQTDNIAAPVIVGAEPELRVIVRSVPARQLGGSIVLAATRPDFPTATESALIDAAANQLSTWADSSRLVANWRHTERLLAERTQHAQLGADIGKALVEHDSLAIVLARCAAALVEHLGVELARVWTLSQDGKTLELQGSAGPYEDPDGPHAYVPVGELEVGHIAADGQPRIRNLAPRGVDAGAEAVPPTDLGFAGFPLLFEDQVLGVVAVLMRYPLSDKSLEAIASASNQMALGIARRRVDEDRARALVREQAARVRAEAAERRATERSEAVETINRVCRTLSAELDTQSLIQVVTDAATELTGAKFGAFFYNVESENKEISRLYTLSGVPLETFEKYPLPSNTAMFGPSFRDEGVVRIDDVKHAPRYGQNSPYHGIPEWHLPVTSYLAVPVTSRSGEVLGGLFFGHPEAGVFSEREERIVVGLAAQTAIAIDNARLYEAEKKARTEAETVNRAKDAFIATVSHELRTPLSPIMLWASMLKSGNLDREKTLKAIDTIERSAKSQVQLIEDLLDVSRITSGKLRIEVHPMRLPPVIDAAVDVVRPAADAKGVILQTVLDTETPAISGDGSRLQQVVWNLLSNAVKFTPNGGRVTITLQCVDGNAEIVVSDTGKGIAADVLPVIFERFRQADSSASRSAGGLGLGLAIVRHIVDAHGGSVQAESAGENQGSSFAVRLPLMGQPQAGEEPRRRQAPALINATFEHVSLAGMRVLVVDDEVDSHEAVRQLLASCGAEVQVAASAEQARGVMERWKPDLLVSDIGMPGEDGYAFLAKLRANERDGARLPAVALTAYNTRDDRARVLSVGFQAHVPKPVDPAELVSVVANLGRR